MTKSTTIKKKKECKKKKKETHTHKAGVQPEIKLLCLSPQINLGPSFREEAVEKAALILQKESLQEVVTTHDI